MTTPNMRSWQKGFDLDYLLGIESFYSRYNDYALSPFTEMKKHIIANLLSTNELKVYNHEDTPVVMMKHKVTKVRTPIAMYKNVLIGIKEPGDVSISNFEWNRQHRNHAFYVLTSFIDPVWCTIWAEDKETWALMEEAGYEWVGSKITSMAEVIAVFFKNGPGYLLYPNEVRQHPIRHAIEDVGIMKTNIPKEEILPYINGIVSRINQYAPVFTNHYSKYNKDKSWSALSLRGYTADPAFITKPEEMNDKWKEENKNIQFELQDTELRAKLDVECLLDLLPTNNIHRVRIMKLSCGGGELARHTDQVDPDVGTTDGKLMRFHFPLVTNSEVTFKSWNAKGISDTYHMENGECWYLDTRKPHSAVNFGNTDRIHLVVDVEVTDKLKEIFGDVSV